MISINNNPLANNVTNKLTAHYADLSKAVKQLASGKRINDASDGDTAALSVSATMRSDIRTLSQGAKNIADAISMLQYADSLLTKVKDNLTRMKELALQAEAGINLNPTQIRLLDDEYQTLAEEIDHITKAAEYNGIHLLNAEPAGTKIAVDTTRADVLVGDPNDGLHIFTEDTTIVNPSAITAPANFKIGTLKLADIVSYKGDPNIRYWYAYSTMQSGVSVENATITLRYTAATNTWEILDGAGPGQLFEGVKVDQYSTKDYLTLNDGAGKYIGLAGFPNKDVITPDGTIIKSPLNGGSYVSVGDVEFTLRLHDNAFNFVYDTLNTEYYAFDNNGNYTNAKVNYNYTIAGNEVVQIFDIDLDNDGTTDIIQRYARLMNAPAWIGQESLALEVASFNINIEYKTQDNAETHIIHFGTGNSSAEDYYSIRQVASTLDGLGIDALDILTQDNARATLVALDKALETNLTQRSYYSTMNSRLATSLNHNMTMIRNLQVAEAKVADTDLATSMAEFVRKRILMEISISMLSQANTLPQMAMALLDPPANLLSRSSTVSVRNATRIMDNILKNHYSVTNINNSSKF